jgi:hypothetical protein
MHGGERTVPNCLSENTLSCDVNSEGEGNAMQTELEQRRGDDSPRNEC